MHLLWSVVVIGWFVTGAGAVAVAAGEGPVVATQCGLAEGVQVSLANGTFVNVWRSLPYAMAPVGVRRYMPPSPYCWPHSTAPFNATSYNNVCIQMVGSTAVGDEDCLFLDVHVPSSAGVGAPVLFYIHGGSLMMGAGQNENVGKLAARLRVIVVTIQYRLNVYGWLCVDSLPSCNLVRRRSVTLLSCIRATHDGWQEEQCDHQCWSSE
jgi:carboxylesterase type B